MKAFSFLAWSVLAGTAFCFQLLCQVGYGDEQAKLIAHRGGVVDQERIENNVPAMREAVRRGYWMIEVDIRESKDGRLVVHHDENFQRFYGDDRRLADLTWNEIRELKSRPGRLRPLLFHEFVQACRGKIRLMIDTKGPQHDRAFYQQMEKILRENDLLKSAYFIGTAESQTYFQHEARISVDRRALRAALRAGQPVRERFFLFEHGNELNEETVRMAQQAGVPVVPSVNVFHYATKDHTPLAARDIRRLRALGVTQFQIDSVYEKFCRE